MVLILSVRIFFLALNILRFRMQFILVFNFPGFRISHVIYMVLNMQFIPGSVRPFLEYFRAW